MLHENLDTLEPIAERLTDNRGCQSVTRASRTEATPRPSALTILAHDLRGPLASLGMLIELMETHGKRRSVDEIAQSARRAGNIIDGLEEMLNSVLARVRRTGDPMGYEPEPICLDHVIKTGILTTLPAAERKSIRIICRLNEPMWINGDKRLLLQVIENLVGNAIKHSSSGMIVTCTLSRIGMQAVLRIEDTGTGLTETDLHRAFNPFTTLSSKASDTSRSWGLGLWIVKLIVEQHGGLIAATSQGPGTGSAFSISLPLLP